ncbi:hypothetical protein ABW19_dt0204473 [Dactylella cylindrospora]|nr:hypothetical protein ABW19_dt0204473 [Dactylella cylindrospora]
MNNSRNDQLPSVISRRADRELRNQKNPDREVIGLGSLTAEQLLKCAESISGQIDDLKEQVGEKYEELRKIEKALVRIGGMELLKCMKCPQPRSLYFERELPTEAHPKPRFEQDSNQTSERQGGRPRGLVMQPQLGLGRFR